MLHVPLALRLKSGRPMNFDTVNHVDLLMMRRALKAMQKHVVVK